MTIGRVASRIGLSVDTLRFYEKRGLIAPNRAPSGYRHFSEDMLDRLRFITDAKELGFSLREIKELLSLGVKSTRECGPVTRKAEAKLALMKQEIRRLQGLKQTLEKMIRDCGGNCDSDCDCSEPHRSAHRASRKSAMLKTARNR